MLGDVSSSFLFFPWDVCFQVCCWMGNCSSRALDKASLASLTLHTLMLLFLSSLASCSWLVDFLFDFPSSFYDSGSIFLTIRERVNIPGYHFSHTPFFSARGHDFLIQITKKKKGKKWDMREVNRLGWG